MHDMKKNPIILQSTPLFRKYGIKPFITAPVALSDLKLCETKKACYLDRVDMSIQV